MWNIEQFSLAKLIVIGLQKLSPYTNQIIDFFLIFCLLFLFLALYKRNSHFAEIAPNLLTSLGLLGGFLVAFVGFSVFDINDIENSIPHLLGDLGIAFIISLVGISLALVMTAVNKRTIAKKEKASQNVTPTVIYLTLREISVYNVAQKSLLSDIVGQLKGLQQNVQDILNLQQTSFTQGIHSLEEIKNSLRGKDENSLITQKLSLSDEQNENFKELNQAIKSLVAQQNNYSEQMTSTQFSDSSGDTQKSRAALQEMITLFQSVPETVQQFTQLMQGLQQQFKNIELHLESFQHLRQQTDETFPAIEKNFSELTQGMQQAMQHNLELLETALETQLDMAEVVLEKHLDKLQVLPKSNFAIDDQMEHAEKPERLEVLTNEKQEVPINNEIPHHSIMEAEKLLAEEWGEESVEKSEMVSEKAQLSTQNIPTPLEQEYAKLQETLASQTTSTQSIDIDDIPQMDDYEALQNQAYTFMDEGYYEEAIVYFEQAIQLKYDEFSLFYNKACCHAKLEQTELAITELQQAIFLNTECIEMAINDSDFDKIKDDTRFQSLL
ncbi:hypothetical protein [Candidatus Parabeggiatoa sp. HSG14]|uniref:tetratricopeptide repeat protein n=1 Tax=Candidatus Parabeggiatoa sp. HSG14 TaxID=3055593 RepID=UPI0025A78173|nr:hypothetical protein [Thiotrichales bacterium HSG14]